MSSPRPSDSVTLPRPDDPAPPETRAAGPPGPLATVWSSRGRALATAAGIAAVAGLVTGWLTPRGPLTEVEVVWTLLLVLAVGVGVGLATGSRWSFLLAPVAYVLAFELVRIGADGPTVDGMYLGSMYGQMAAAIGRGAHGLIIFPPMLLGAGLGVWLAHRWGHPTAPRPGIPAWLLTGMTAAVVIVLAVSLVRPGTTAPILGADGEPLPGSIAELVTVEIGGVDQVLMLRGASIDNPVMLHLSGGPGGTDLGPMSTAAELESDFVVATWEQRGTGQSYATSIDPYDQLTLEQAVADTIEVTEYLRDRFDEDKIVLEANSWGTIPSTFAVQQRPKLYHAYVSTGQMVNNRLTDQMFAEDALAWAEATGRDGLAEQIREVGLPPYENLLHYEYTVSYEHQWNDYPGVDDLHEMPANTIVRENNLLDIINASRALLDVNFAVYPQLQDHDFRRDVPALDVPVYMVLGAHEARGRAVLADEWFDLLDAPSKERIVFEQSAHRPSFEQPDDFAALMRRVAAETLPATTG